MTYHKQVIIIDNEASCRNKLQIGKNINLGGIKMKAKTILSLLLVIALSGSLTACGSASPAASSTASVSSAPAASTEKIDLTAPMLGYSEQQIATAKQNGGGSTSAADNYYIAVTNSIAKDYPNYNMNYVDWGWAEQLDSKQRALISSGNVPDLVAGETFIPDYANGDILSPLPKDIVDELNPSFLIYNKSQQPVAVAYTSSTFMLFYNKTLVKKAGLDPDNPPKTWDEWQQYSNAITKAGNGKFWGGGIPSFPELGGALRATPFFRQLGVDFVKDGKLNLDDPKIQQVLEFIRQMNANFPNGIANNPDEGPFANAFEKDQIIAYAVNGGWQGTACTENKMDWGVTPLPVAPGGNPNSNCMVGSIYLAVPKGAKNPEASFNLIREALKPENEMYRVYNTCAVPLNSIINDTSLYDKDPVESTLMKQLTSGTYTGLAVWPKNGSQIWNIICQNVIARTTISNDPISKICSDATTQINALLQ